MNDGKDRNAANHRSEVKLPLVLHSEHPPGPRVEHLFKRRLGMHAVREDAVNSERTAVVSVLVNVFERGPDLRSVAVGRAVLSAQINQPVKGAQKTARRRQLTRPAGPR